MTLTREVPAAEIRIDAEELYSKEPTSLNWLKRERDFAAADRLEAQQSNDQVGWTKHDDRCRQLGQVVRDLENMKRMLDACHAVIRGNTIEIKLIKD